MSPARMGAFSWPWLAAMTAMGAATMWWYRRRPARAAAAMARGGQRAATGLDETDRTVEDSFPASDPPAWSGATASGVGAPDAGH